jgi:hypothetical protein
MATLKVDGLTKRYRTIAVVNDVSFTVLPWRAAKLPVTWVLTVRANRRQ